MNSQKTDLESSLFSTIDLRAFAETVRLRWWIIPAVIGIVVLFLQAQDSDLRTSPATYVVSRGYEFETPQRALAGIGINLEVVEFPDPDAQLLILQRDDVRQEISDGLGRDVAVQTPVSFEVPTTFTCNQPAIELCEKAIEAYVAKIVEIRRQAISKGIQNLMVVLKGASETSSDPLVQKQLGALDALSKDIRVSSILVDGFEQSIGSTVTDVRQSTLIMGIASGFLISILVLLQLTMTDGRIRSTRQLVRLVGQARYIGQVSKKPNSFHDRQTAVSLLSGLREKSGTGIRVLPLTSYRRDLLNLSRVFEMSDIPHSVTSPISDLSISELMAKSTSEADVVVIQRNRDQKKNVLEAVLMMARSGRQFVGVILID